MRKCDNTTQYKQGGRSTKLLLLYVDEYLPNTLRESINGCQFIGRAQWTLRMMTRVGPHYVVFLSMCRVGSKLVIAPMKKKKQIKIDFR